MTPVLLYYSIHTSSLKVAVKMSMSVSPLLESATMWRNFTEMNVFLLAALFPNTPHPSSSAHVAHIWLFTFPLRCCFNWSKTRFSLTAMHTKQYCASAALVVTCRLKHAHHTHIHTHIHDHGTNPAMQMMLWNSRTSVHRGEMDNIYWRF